MNNKRKSVTTVQVQKPAPSKLLMGLASPGHRAEGAPVSRTEIERLPDGRVRYAVDLSTAQVPQRRYVADTATAEYNGLEVNLIFGQTKMYGVGFESALAVKFNLNAFEDLVRALNANIEAEIAKVKKSLSLKTETLRGVDSEPTHSAKLIANIANYAMAGHETCIDFYHMNAYANARLDKSDTVDVEAVVRVDLRTSLFVALSAELGNIATRIAAGE